MKYLLKNVFWILIVAITACTVNNTNDVNKLNEQIKQLVAGDTLVISNGTYSDVLLKINNIATQEKPIVIKAETPGKVVFSGNSRMLIGGDFVEISGLLFENGSSENKPVICFKGKKGANNCRLTNCAINNYNPSDRFMKNTWVELYGKNNRVDHCSFTGKLNSGVTLVVKLSGKEHQENNHSIDHNYFGPRLRLGSNGGETMRIGTSTYSLTSSNTNVTSNYFEKCSGEVEIVSIKSSDNNISNNTFYECEGVLTLRHGNRNTLDGNVFIGNNKPHTGGIRVINAGHKITNNHFQELKGDRFRAALPVMNGVPNSAINRYHQVKDAEISLNALINCDNIVFGVGSDNERTAIPENVVFRNNILYYPNSNTVYKSLVSTKGIDFKENQVVTKNKNFAQKGFIKSNITFEKNADGLYASETYKPELKATLENTGASWFKKAEAEKRVGTEVKVGSGDNLVEKVKNAQENDIILLNESANYIINEPIVVNKPIVIKGTTDLAIKPSIQYAKNNGKPILLIENGGEIIIENVILNGASETGYAKAAIATQSEPMIYHYNIFANNVDFTNYAVGGASVLYAFKSTFADTIQFENCTFSNVSGVAINLSSENEDKGKYNVENVIIKNCLFTDLLGSAVKLYRGGNDESTLGPFLTIDQCTFHNIENRELGSCLNLNGVQHITITNSIFSESGKSGRVIKLEDQNWIYCNIDYVNFYNSGRFESFYSGRLGKHVWKLNPQYNSIENKDFNLKASSPLATKSDSKGKLGYSNK